MSTTISSTHRFVARAARSGADVDRGGGGLRAGELDARLEMSLYSSCALVVCTVARMLWARGGGSMASAPKTAVGNGGMLAE